MKGRITYEGYHFKNPNELRRYKGVMELVKAGRLKDMDVYPQYELVINDISVSEYHPTFRFYDPDKHNYRFIQVMSGTYNPALELKIKLFEAIYGETVEKWG